MCRINYNNGRERGEARKLSLPQPRIAWAVPVDVAELGARLEAHLNLEDEVLTLQMAHRFRQGQLSRLPQELLNQVIDEMLQTEYDRVRNRWLNKFACFQDRCMLQQHYEAEDTEDAIEADWRFLVGGLDIEPYHSSGVTRAEKVDRVQKAVWEGDITENVDADHAWSHEFVAQKWINQTCMCLEKQEGNVHSDGRFAPLNDFLMYRFGLEAIILHETIEYELFNSFPDKFWNHWDEDMPAYSTVAFLALPSPPKIKPHESTSRHRRHGTKPVGRTKLDLPSLAISDAQRLRFKKTLRALGLQPSFHLTDLPNSSLCSDDRTKDFCVCDRCCHPFRKKGEGAVKQFHKYLLEMNEVCARQEWPQLMHIFPSQAVELEGRIVR